jgi:hypothetical protein
MIFGKEQHRIHAQPFGQCNPGLMGDLSLVDLPTHQRQSPASAGRCQMMSFRYC